MWLAVRLITKAATLSGVSRHAMGDIRDRRAELSKTVGVIQVELFERHANQSCWLSLASSAMFRIAA